MTDMMEINLGLGRAAIHYNWVKKPILETQVVHLLFNSGHVSYIVHSYPRSEPIHPSIQHSILL